MHSTHPYLSGLIVAALLVASATAYGQDAYSDDFTGTHSVLQWKPLGFACMTAGDGSGTIPACGGTQQPKGEGALRLTPATDYTTGAILSDFTFPLSQGLQVTFTTYTYGGTPPYKWYPSGLQTGADGMSFFLTDGTKPLPENTGGSGGALGYSCSNTNTKADPATGFLHVQGVPWGYLGLGMDEYGNYLNAGDTTNSGILNTNATAGSTAHGTNPYYDGNVNSATPYGDGGPQFQPQRIGLRGAGNVTWAWLHAQNPDYYTAGSYTSGWDQADKIRNVCASGKYVASGSNGGKHLTDLPLGNYRAIPGGYHVLSESTLMSNVNAKKRTDATPITYKLSISSTGYLNFSYSYNAGTFQPVLTNQNIVAINGALPESFRFGFSGGTGGQNNVHELTCFEARPLQSNSSAAANTERSGEVRTGTQVFLASYSPNSWWGSLQAVSLVGVDGVLQAADIANWDARCRLTGGLCTPMGTDANGDPKSVTGQKPADRVLYTWNGTGVPLQWGQLSSAQQGDLRQTPSEDVQVAKDRLQWLRGDRSNEQLQSATGTLRARIFTLGDIIDSSPTWVGGPMLDYPTTFKDALYAGAVNPENTAGAQTYAAFASALAGRINVVYVGSNDGFLHGFSSGTYGATGSFDNTLNDGTELLGYMPRDVLADKARKLTDPNYAHDYLVDAAPAVGDVFYAGKWHTWLVGGVGTSGREIYALDVTDPARFSNANAASVVIGDWNNATPGLDHLGHTVGAPIFARLHSGQWAFVFGSGMDAPGKTAGVYLGLIDPDNGKVSFQFLDTGVSGAGIAYVTAADLDGDQIADYLYAGDTKGNVWRFDVTSDSPGGWKVSTYGKATPTPLFVARDAGGAVQPITTQVILAAIDVKTGETPAGKDVIKPAYMAYFGTGQKIPETATHGNQYAEGTQTFYGIWDWGMGDWNGLSSANDAATASAAGDIKRADLLEQKVVDETVDPGTTEMIQGRRTLSTKLELCLSGLKMCATGNTQYGWYFDLPEEHEQIIYSPTIISGAVVVNTAVPPTSGDNACVVTRQTGWTMAFDPRNGGSLPSSFFLNALGQYDEGGNAGTSGVKLDAVGTPISMTYNGKAYLVTQTSSGKPAVIEHNQLPPASMSSTPERVSWKEMN